MGAGRKTTTIQVSETSLWSTMDGNSSIARKLAKGDLGGVIFGCKHNTIDECLSKQLFGIPYSHICYVKNIEPGLPLFLFNYSDRKLLGIYEATSCGQLNIDPYAWADDGSERTPFPAQVCVRTRNQCRPLEEKEFKKVIADNYFAVHHFWFELDCTQTRKLIALFMKSRSSSTNIPVSAEVRSSRGPSGIPGKTRAVESSVNAQARLALRNKNRFDLLLDAGDIDQTSSSSSKADTESKQTLSDWEDFSEDGVPVVDSQVGAATFLEDSLPVIDSQVGADTFIANEATSQVSHPSVSAHVGLEDKSFPEKQLGPGCRGSNAGIESAIMELDNVSAECTVLVSFPDCQTNDCNDCGSSKLMYEGGPQSTLESMAVTDEHAATFELHSGESELVQVVTNLQDQVLNLEKKQIESSLEIQNLKDRLYDSGRIIEQLNGRVKNMEKKLDPSVVDNSVMRCIDQHIGSTSTIYLAGGFNGSTWLSTFDAFSPSTDELTPLQSMTSARSYAGAAVLNGDIYVFGGGNGSLWYETVERYDRRENKWTLCPNLNRGKGNLGGACLDGKIYAIGGGNGRECFADVEIFDPDRGEWKYIQPMHEKRFATATVELNGLLYVVGGYDGISYLKSMERYDPRENRWHKLPNINKKRGGHSLKVFNEKIYAIGGYDGDQKKMVASVETFEPRNNRWHMHEPMNYPRGYAATAVVGDILYVIGGVRDGETIEDTVEYYLVNTGWVVSRLKAVGKRCFCSAVVI